jgi:endonuclease/exonuclease/phosphatase family metal-dependent hydrolase
MVRVVRRRLRVATFNLHAGIDGFGRPTDVVDTAVELDADVLFVQESWRTPTYDLAQEIASRTGAVAHTFSLARGFRRKRGEGGPGRWQARGALLTGRHGILLDDVRPLTPEHRRQLEADPGRETGEWCMGFVSRLEVLEVATVELRHLHRDRARRLLVSATLRHESGPVRCFTLHGAHLSHGSIGQYRELTRYLDKLLADADRVVLGGDLNCWGLVMRQVLRDWRQVARGATWPSWRPHSQLDHLFVRGDLDAEEGHVVDARGSDHRPVVATLTV